MLRWIGYFPVSIINWILKSYDLTIWNYETLIDCINVEKIRSSQDFSLTNSCAELSFSLLVWQNFDTIAYIINLIKSSNLNKLFQNLSANFILTGFKKFDALMLNVFFFFPLMFSGNVLFNRNGIFMQTW